MSVEGSGHGQGPGWLCEGLRGSVALASHTEISDFRLRVVKGSASAGAAREYGTVLQQPQ